jgi:hypothetical protein
MKNTYEISTIEKPNSFLSTNYPCSLQPTEKLSVREKNCRGQTESMLKIEEIMPKSQRWPLGKYNGFPAWLNFNLTDNISLRSQTLHAGIYGLEKL